MSSTNRVGIDALLELPAASFGVVVYFHFSLRFKLRTSDSSNSSTTSLAVVVVVVALVVTSVVVVAVVVVVVVVVC